MSTIDISGNELFQQNLTAQFICSSEYMGIKSHIYILKNLQYHYYLYLFIWRNITIKLCGTEKFWMTDINVFMAAYKFKYDLCISVIRYNNSDQLVKCFYKDPFKSAEVNKLENFQPLSLHSCNTTKVDIYIYYGRPHKLQIIILLWKLEAQLQLTNNAHSPSTYVDISKRPTLIRRSISLLDI